MTGARHFLDGLRVFAGASPAPFPVDAVVVEQDCDLVLETEPVLREPRASLEDLVRAIESAPARSPGTVLVRRDEQPARLVAIVHDFSAEPSLREAWVAAALDEVWRCCATLGVAALALPMLGSVHGALPVTRALALVEQSLWRRRPGGLGRLWLRMPHAQAVLLPERWREHGCTVELAGP